jgi:hypothetical protein
VKPTPASHALIRCSVHGAPRQRRGWSPAWSRCALPWFCSASSASPVAIPRRRCPLCVSTFPMTRAMSRSPGSRSKRGSISERTVTAAAAKRSTSSGLTAVRRCPQAAAWDANRQTVPSSARGAASTSSHRRIRSSTSAYGRPVTVATTSTSASFSESHPPRSASAARSAPASGAAHFGAPLPADGCRACSR